MADRYSDMRRAKRDGRPSMRKGSNLMVDPALIETLCIRACAVNMNTELHECPECEAEHENAKLIKHDDDCPIGDLFKRAIWNLHQEAG